MEVNAEFIEGQELYASDRCRVSCERFRIDAERAAERVIVHHPGAVAIIARPEADRLVLVHQYRYSIRAWSWEIPAGTRASGETIDACAGRELAEETGYRADSFRTLGMIHPAIGLCDEELHLVEAIGLRRGSVHLEPDELLEVHIMDRERVTQMVADGTITDAKTLVALARIGWSVHRGPVAG
ncbi:MAG: NUDIX hydrolase [Planctomycetota bacterium]